MDRVDLKVILLGNAAVGKTSLVTRFVHETFNESLAYQNTIGAAFAAKQMQIDGKRLVMGIWDTAGSERYDAMIRLYYRGAKAAIICYDITQSHTFQRAKYWVTELRSMEEGCQIYLCATKKDMCEQEISASPDLDTVRTYANGIQAKLFITSSKTGENVAELFTEIAQDFVALPEHREMLEEAISLNTESSTSYYCCQLR